MVICEDYRDPEQWIKWENNNVRGERITMWQGYQKSEFRTKWKEDKLADNVGISRRGPFNAFQRSTASSTHALKNVQGWSGQLVHYSHVQYNSTAPDELSHRPQGHYAPLKWNTRCCHNVFRRLWRTWLQTLRALSDECPLVAVFTGHLHMFTYAWLTPSVQLHKSKRCQENWEKIPSDATTVHDKLQLKGFHLLFVCWVVKGSNPAGQQL